MENLFNLYQETLINQVKNNGDLSTNNLMQLMSLHKQDINNELQGTDEGMELLPVEDYIPQINISKVQSLKDKLEEDIENVTKKTDQEKELLEKKHFNFSEISRYVSMIEVVKENLKDLKEQKTSELFVKIKSIEDNGGEAGKLKEDLKNIDGLPEIKKQIETIEKLNTRLEKIKGNSINGVDYEKTIKFLDDHEIELKENLLNQFKIDLSELKYKGGVSIISSLNKEFKEKLNGGFSFEKQLNDVEKKEIIEDAKKLIELIDENIDIHSHILKHSLGIHPDYWDMSNMPFPTKKPLKLAKLLGDDYFKTTYKNQIELQFGDKKMKYSLNEINNLDTIPNEKYDNEKSYLENFKNGITKRRSVLEAERQGWIDEINSKVKNALSDSNKIYIVKKELANGLLMLRTLANDNKYFKHYHTV